MKWFKAQAADKIAKVVIDKPIGSDWAPDWIKDFTNELPARDFIKAIDDLGDLNEIDLEINSPGGDVASGIRIMNYLKNHKAKVNVKVTGTAASIATVIMMAGDTRTMGVGTTIMTHRASALMLGYFTAKEMEDFAQNIKAIDAAMVDAYVAGTGKTAEEISALLDKGDIYMGADEAIEWGFATDKDAKLLAVACEDPKLFKQQLEMQGKIKAAEAKEAQLESQISELQKLQANAIKAETITAEWLTENRQDLVKAIAAEAEGLAIKAERERASAIIQACDAASQPQLMQKLVSNGSLEAAAKEYIFDIAAASGANINSQHSDNGGKPSVAIDYNKIYAKLNKPTNVQ